MDIDIKGLRKRFNIPWNRKFIVVKKDTVSMGGRYWDGGSKDEYYLLSPVSGNKRIPDAPFPNPRDEWDKYELKINEAILKLGTFCGKPATPVLYIREVDTYTPDVNTHRREY